MGGNCQYEILKERETGSHTEHSDQKVSLFDSGFATEGCGIPIRGNKYSPRYVLSFPLLALYQNCQ